MRFGWAVIACAVLAAPIAMAQNKNDAFKVDRRSFKKTYPVIALAPVDADPYLEMPERVAAILEREVTARLQKENFNVIPSTVLGDIRKTMESQIGGITDPETGQVVPEKQAAVREHAFRELWFREQFDALGVIRVSVAQVPMESDRVEWDGVKRRITYEGRSKKYSANVMVSSVSLAMFDSTDRPIYTWYGGLEPVMYRDGEQLQPLAVDKLFLDEDHIRKAVDVIVDPF